MSVAYFMKLVKWFFLMRRTYSVNVFFCVLRLKKKNSIAIKSKVLLKRKETMNNLIKITAVAGVAILSGCVGSLDVPEGGLGTVGNTSTTTTIISNNVGDSIINIGGTVIGTVGGGGNVNRDNVNRNNLNSLIIPRTGFTQLESLLAQADSSENLVASVTYDYDNEEITARNRQNVSITGGDNRFIANIAGKEYILSNIADNNANAVNNGTGDFLVRRQHYADGGLNPNTPNDYILFQYGVYDDITNIDYSGYAVVGIQTPQQSIPTTASATYTGGISALASYDGDTANFLLGGRIDMDVHFGRRTISGRISNIEEYIHDVVIPANAVIELNQTTFRADGSYNGTLTIYSNFGDAVGINTYAGGYYGDTYGPNASSLAGVFQLYGNSIINEGYAISGGFYADK